MAVTSDTTPDAFALTDAINPVVHGYESAPITVAGINAATAISVSGASGQYQINGGAWVSTPGTVVAGNSVKVRGTSSPTPGVTVDILLTIGGIPDTFSITTAKQAR